MKMLLLALQFLRRDWRSGEIRLLSLALLVAVAAVSAVGFFTDRVDQAMLLQANEVLAADLVISGSRPIPEQFSERAKQLGLATAATLNFPSVVMRNDETLLVEIKAVSPGYPLRGELRTRPQLTADETVQQGTPEPGSIWGEARILATLGLGPGDTVSLGEQNFTFEQVLTRDSASGRGFLRLGPRVLMALEDIPSTGLVTPASRVHHRLLVAGSLDRVEEYRLWAKRLLPEGYSLEHMSNARPELKNALERGGRFLALAALAAVLVAGVTIALSARRFVERQSDTSAIMRCLGATSRTILKVLVLRLLILGLLATLGGTLLGLAAQQLLTGMLQEWLGTALPPPGLRPLFIGLGTGMITLVGFTLPPALRLGDVPPLKVLRRDLGAPPASVWLLSFSSFAAIGLLMLWQAGEIKLALAVLVGTLVTALLLLLTSWSLIRLLKPLRHRGGTAWRYGLAGLVRSPAMTALQLSGFGLGILALLLLAVIRLDLLSAWKKSIPDEAPNQFLINILPQEVSGIDRFLKSREMAGDGLYPMLRARLIQINNRSVSAEDYQEQRARRLISREFNLSWAEEMQGHNRITAGKWWPAGDANPGQFSVEVDLAETLGIRLHDRLVFNLAGTEIAGRVTSLREVRWDSFQPNFFVIGTPKLLQDYPTTYITSFHLPDGKEALLAELIRNFPSVTVIDVRAILQQVREIMERGSMAVEYVFLFTLSAGLLMLFAGIQANREHRRQEAVILRTLGLGRLELMKAAAVEFFTLGLLSGLLASLTATATGWFLANQVFGFPFHFNPWIWIIGILGSGLGIGAAGLLATWPLTIRPPLQTLRGS